MHHKTMSRIWFRRLIAVPLLAAFIYFNDGTTWSCSALRVPASSSSSSLPLRNAEEEAPPHADAGAGPPAAQAQFSSSVAGVGELELARPKVPGAAAADAARQRSELKAKIGYLRDYLHEVCESTWKAKFAEDIDCNKFVAALDKIKQDSEDSDRREMKKLLTRIQTLYVARLKELQSQQKGKKGGPGRGRSQSPSPSRSRSRSRKSQRTGQEQHLREGRQEEQQDQHREQVPVLKTPGLEAYETAQQGLDNAARRRGLKRQRRSSGSSYERADDYGDELQELYDMEEGCARADQSAQSTLESRALQLAITDYAKEYIRESEIFAGAGRPRANLPVRVASWMVSELTALLVTTAFMQTAGQLHVAIPAAQAIPFHYELAVFGFPFLVNFFGNRLSGATKWVSKGIGMCSLALAVQAFKWPVALTPLGVATNLVPAALRGAQAVLPTSADRKRRRCEGCFDTIADEIGAPSKEVVAAERFQFRSFVANSMFSLAAKTTESLFPGRSTEEMLDLHTRAVVVGVPLAEVLWSYLEDPSQMDAHTQRAAVALTRVFVVYVLTSGTPQTVKSVLTKFLPKWPKHPVFRVLQKGTVAVSALAALYAVYFIVDKGPAALEDGSGLDALIAKHGPFANHTVCATPENMLLPEHNRSSFTEGLLHELGCIKEKMLEQEQQGSSSAGAALSGLCSSSSLAPASKELTNAHSLVHESFAKVPGGRSKEAFCEDEGIADGIRFFNHHLQRLTAQTKGSMDAAKCDIRVSEAAADFPKPVCGGTHIPPAFASKYIEIDPKTNECRAHYPEYTSMGRAAQEALAHHQTRQMEQPTAQQSGRHALPAPSSVAALEQSSTSSDARALAHGESLGAVIPCGRSSGDRPFGSSRPIKPILTGAAAAAGEGLVSSSDSTQRQLVRQQLDNSQQVAVSAGQAPGALFGRERTLRQHVEKTAGPLVAALTTAGGRLLPALQQQAGQLSGPSSTAVQEFYREQVFPAPSAQAVPVIPPVGEESSNVEPVSQAAPTFDAEGRFIGISAMPQQHSGGAISDTYRGQLIDGVQRSAQISAERGAHIVRAIEGQSRVNFWTGPFRATRALLKHRLQVLRENANWRAALTQLRTNSADAESVLSGSGNRLQLLELLDQALKSTQKGWNALKKLPISQLVKVLRDTAESGATSSPDEAASP
ncbi:unnamed protein product [Amoebophrya sp. A120]|nr:unnamed protein product [Amoebophrya sp. A120]|eukprot:GSA120T00006446001.1